MKCCGSDLRERLAAARLLLTALLAGCASVVRNASDRFAANLGNAVLDSEDPATVRDGLPCLPAAARQPRCRSRGGDVDNASTLLAAARLNSRLRRQLHRRRQAARPPPGRSKSFRLRHAAPPACCDAPLCAAHRSATRRSSHAVVAADEHTELMYVLAGSWAGLPAGQFRRLGRDRRPAEDPEPARARGRARPRHDHGQAWIYLGVLNSLRPEAIGGKPAEGRPQISRRRSNFPAAATSMQRRCSRSSTRA